MRELLHIAAFWVVVVVAIRVAVCFPHSVPARILFSRLGPLPLRGEPQAHYLLRCARFGGSWFLQAVVLFGLGGVALGWDASLADSSFFLVLWAVVVPLLGGGALVAALFALGRAIWARRFGRGGSLSGSAHATQA
jgi:hypothetical protein